MARPILRFAPSPNGFLHLGHAYSALMNEAVATRLGGAVLLRLENIDTVRCRPDYEVAIVEDLRWLGFRPSDAILRQSDRLPAYRAVLRRLADRGLVYPCFCTRGSIARAIDGCPDWPRDPDGAPLYPGTCRALPLAERRARLAAGEPAAFRLDLGRAWAETDGALFWDEFGESSERVRRAAHPEAWGDALLARKDIGTSYHLAAVTDDAAQGVTNVVRGADLLEATSLHRLLQVLLGFAAPSYHHHRLILDGSGRKLSKSVGSPALRDLRHEGATPDDVRRQLGFP